FVLESRPVDRAARGIPGSVWRQSLITTRGRRPRRARRVDGIANLLDCRARQPEHGCAGACDRPGGASARLRHAAGRSRAVLAFAEHSGAVPFSAGSPAEPLRQFVLVAHRPGETRATTAGGTARPLRGISARAASRARADLCFPRRIARAGTQTTPVAGRLLA